MSKLKYLRLVNTGEVGNKAELLIGDTLIPFYKATVTVEVGCLNTITLTAPLESLDIIMDATQVKGIVKEQDLVIDQTSESIFKQERWNHYSAYKRDGSYVYSARASIWSPEEIKDIIDQEWIDYCDELEEKKQGQYD